MCDLHLPYFSTALHFNARCSITTQSAALAPLHIAFPIRTLLIYQSSTISTTVCNRRLRVLGCCIHTNDRSNQSAGVIEDSTECTLSCTSSASRPYTIAVFGMRPTSRVASCWHSLAKSFASTHHSSTLSRYLTYSCRRFSSFTTSTAPTPPVVASYQWPSSLASVLPASVSSSSSPVLPSSSSPSSSPFAPSPLHSVSSLFPFLPSPHFSLHPTLPTHLLPNVQPLPRDDTAADSMSCDTIDSGMLCDSVKRKRVKKMNRHKHKKRLKKERHSTRKSHT